MTDNAPAPLPTAPRLSLIPDLAIAYACLTLLVISSPTQMIVWDEPNAMHRADILTQWLALWFQESGPPAWSVDSIRQYVFYTTSFEGHPAVYGLVIALGRCLTSTWLPATESYRFGPMLLFSIAVAVLFRRIRTDYGWLSALVAVISLLTMPRLFAHAHFASIDGPLTSSWLLAVVTFERARKSNLGCVVWGTMLGLTLGCKFTGWLALPGFVLWAALYPNKTNWRVAAGMAVALMVFINVNPPLWHDPINGMKQFFWMNTHRDKLGLNIPILFLGTRYDLTHPAPWYNSMAWVIFTVPVGTVVLITCGVVRALKNWRTEPFGMLLLIEAAIPLTVRALPMAPPHDAERLFLPTFPLLGGLAGLGFHWIWTALRPGWKGVTIKSLVACSLALAAAETAWYSPQWLCYYSPVVGGNSGAAGLGLEPTYYWDGLDGEVLDWIEGQSGGKTLVYCSTSPDYDNFRNRHAESRVRFSFNRPEDCDWFLVQNRPGFWNGVERALMENETPRYLKYIRSPSAGFGPWRLDTPVLFVYSRDQFDRINLKSQ